MKHKFHFRKSKFWLQIRKSYLGVFCSEGPLWKLTFYVEAPWTSTHRSRSPLVSADFVKPWIALIWELQSSKYSAGYKNIEQGKMDSPHCIDSFCGGIFTLESVTQTALDTTQHQEQLCSFWCCVESSKCSNPQRAPSPMHYFSPFSLVLHG